MTDAIIRSAALNRLAEVFRTSTGSLHVDMRFGVDLNCSFVSDFRRNEFDLLLNDVHDVADKTIKRALESGELVIETVGDYCLHMVRCSAARRDEVLRVLGIRVDEATHTT